MSGMTVETGLTGSVVGKLFGGGGTTAVAPPRSYVPEGPATVTAAAYGSGGGDSGGNAGMHALIGGIVAFGLLIGLWVTLPR